MQATIYLLISMLINGDYVQASIPMQDMQECYARAKMVQVRLNNDKVTSVIRCGKFI
jgi:hypothetical protein